VIHTIKNDFFLKQLVLVMNTSWFLRSVIAFVIWRRPLLPISKLSIITD